MKIPAGLFRFRPPCLTSQDRKCSPTSRHTVEKIKAAAQPSAEISHTELWNTVGSTHKRPTPKSARMCRHRNAHSQTVWMQDGLEPWKTDSTAAAWKTKLTPTIKNNKHTCYLCRKLKTSPNKNLHTNTNSNFFLNHQNSVATKMSFNRQMDTSNTAHP